MTDKIKKYTEVLKVLTALKNEEQQGLNKARLARIVKAMEVVVEIVKEEN